MAPKRQITAEVAAFIERADIRKAPAEVIERARHLVTDFLGCCAGGAGESAARIVREFIGSDSPGAHPATVVGARGGAQAARAAFVNGVSSHALDFDDVSQPMYGHPTTAVLPAALAVAEAQGASGLELVEAYAVGLEVAAKLSYGMNPAHYRHGWHSTCTLGAVGAAAAAAKLMGLTGSKLRSCLALAASQACGLQQNFGTMTKPFHAGKAAENGVIAAELASRGFTGDQNILEAPLGFFRLFCGPDNYDADAVVDHLGHPWEIASPGIILKKFPSCAFSHPVVDSALEIAATAGFAPERVARVEGHIHDLADQILIHRSPKTGLEAKFSMEATCALALLDRRVTIRSFQDERVRREDLRAMMARIERKRLPPDPEEPRGFGPARVVVHLTDGESLDATTRKAKGHPENPMTEAEIREKYVSLAEGVLTPRCLDESLALLSRLETLPDAAALMRCFAAP